MNYAVGKNPNSRNGFKKGHKHSEEVRQRISIANKGNPKHIGSTHPNWKGGITPFNIAFRKTKEYIIWRTAVFMRDDYTCVECGQKGGDKEADHIKPFSLYPELRLAIDNGRTLCIPCHRQTDTYGGRIISYKERMVL